MVIRTRAILFFYFLLFPISGQIVRVLPGTSISIFILANAVLITFFLVDMAASNTDRLKSFKLNMIYAPIIFFSGLLLIMTLLSSLYSYAPRYIMAHLQLFSILTILSIYIPQVGFETVFKGLFFGGVALAAFDFMAFIQMEAVAPKTDMFGIGYAGIGSFMTFANHGGGMIAGISGGFYLLNSRSFASYRKKIVLAIVFMSLMVIISQSRSGIMALFLSISILTFLPKMLNIMRQKSIKGYFLLSLIFAIGLTVMMILAHIIGDLRPHSITLRLMQYEAAVYYLLEFPLGLGWEVWPKTQILNTEMHNMPLNYALALGVVGFTIVLASVIYGIVLFFVAHKDKKRPEYSIYCGFAIFTGGLVEAFFAPQTPSDWVSLGLVLLSSYYTFERTNSC